MSEQPIRLRIATYNTRDFLDDRRAAARVVRRIDPDVLCLQEVPRRVFGARRVRSFAAECGLFWPGAHRGSGGTTIFLSERLELQATWHRRLSVAVLMRTRGYAVAQVRPPGRPPLLVASVHLSLRAGERHAHTKQIVRELAAVRLDPARESGRRALHSPRGDGPDDQADAHRRGLQQPVGEPTGRTVLAGDLNELDTGLAWRHVGSRMRLVSPSEPTYPARRPRTVLDVIFASPDLTVLPHAPVDLGEEDVRAASDHRPVWADLLV